MKGEMGKQGSGEKKYRAKAAGKPNQGIKILLAYIFGMLGLLLLVGAAFFGPKIVFAMQDDVRCREMVQISREETDVTSFSTGYEKDLYRRLDRFARGLADGVQYYVTVQDLDVTSEEAGRWADELQRQDTLTPAHYLTLSWEIYTFELLDWKRCVIYGDDFTSGVNFILQYMEIGVDGRPVFKLLMDEETGSLYAVRRNYSALPEAVTDNSLDLREHLALLWGVSSFETISGLAAEFGIYLGRAMGGLPIAEVVDVGEEYLEDKTGGGGNGGEGAAAFGSE